MLDVVVDEGVDEEVAVVVTLRETNANEGAHRQKVNADWRKSIGQVFRFCPPGRRSPSQPFSRGTLDPLPRGSRWKPMTGPAGYLQAAGGRRRGSSFRSRRRSSCRAATGWPTGTGRRGPGPAGCPAAGRRNPKPKRWRRRPGGGTNLTSESDRQLPANPPARLPPRRRGRAPGRRRMPSAPTGTALGCRWGRTPTRPARERETVPNGVRRETAPPVVVLKSHNLTTLFVICVPSSPI